MEVRNRGQYEIAGRELVVEGADIRVQVLTLDPGQSVPWHYHNDISDWFVGLEGKTIVETRAPRDRFELAPGERCNVGPLTAHSVHGGGEPCKFMIIQGVGSYDFNLVGGQAAHRPS